MTSPNYSLYLVTDSSCLPTGTTVLSQVSAAIDGGATIVQLREKKLSTAKFIELGRAVHEITSARQVPLLINDRVDVALAVGCEGIHIGWDDCDYKTARRLLGDDKLIGVSVSTSEEALAANEFQPDYLGIGPVFATPTKPDHKTPLGHNGLTSLLNFIHSLSEYGRDVPTVCIGGVNSERLPVIYASTQIAHKRLAGIAVVSAIMAAPDARAVAQAMRNFGEEMQMFQQLSDLPPASPPPDYSIHTEPEIEKVTLQPDNSPTQLHNIFASIFNRVRIARPLVHHITNNVTKTLCANLTLAVSGSPIMSEDSSETQELAAAAAEGGALVVNMGTATVQDRELFTAAIKAHNSYGNPVVFDPVGAGATALRRETARVIVDSGSIAVVKGNEGEIRALAGQGRRGRGVDAGASIGGEIEKATLARDVARLLQCVVVLTGRVDYVSDGGTTWAVDEGHEVMSKVTGTGCGLGSVIAVAVGANRDKVLTATLAAVAVYGYAASIVCQRLMENVGRVGPMIWVERHVDFLYQLVSEELLQVGNKAEYIELVGRYVRRMDV